MRYILRQAALTAVFFSCLYAVALGMTFVILPDPTRAGWLNVSSAGDTLYLTSPKYMFLRRDVLNVPDRKVLLVGASNTSVGFPREQVQGLVSCAKVSDLAIGSANISEVRQIIDLVHEVQNPSARQSNTFVIGVWFGMFVDTELRWPGSERHYGDTDLDIERYRYGFYRRTATGPVAVLPPEWLHVGVTLIRPYLLLEKIARDVTLGFRQTVLGRPRELTDAERETRVMSDEDKTEALAYWRRAMGNTTDISQAQVALLENTIDELLRSGEKVVLVDLPIPAWHRDASLYEPGYVRAVKMVFDHFADRPGFVPLRMADLTANRDYSDEVHPKPHLSDVWSTRLAGVLNPLVCQAIGVPGGKISLQGPAAESAERTAPHTAATLAR